VRNEDEACHRDRSEYSDDQGQASAKEQAVCWEGSIGHENYGSRRLTGSAKRAIGSSGD
jgi:hypothetical protein